jgi:hypothetical protein
MILVEETSPQGWWLNCEKALESVKASIDEHAGRNRNACTHLRPTNSEIVPKLTKSFPSTQYRGNRIKMSGWVKTKMLTQTAQLWVRIDNDDDDYKSAITRPGCFDNMDDRPIISTTDWTKYELVVDVSEQSKTIVFGLFMRGEGEAWLDEVSFEIVTKDVPLSGKYVQAHDL